MTTHPHPTPNRVRARHGRRTRRAALVVAPILALSLAACGDDDTTDDTTVDTGPVATEPSDPVTTDPGVTDPGVTDPGVTDPGTGDPGDDMSLGFDESTIVGLTVEEAREVVENDDRQFRVARVDGEDQALTADLVEGRVNVVVVEGSVESVAFYG